MYTAGITINNKKKTIKKEKILTIGIITKNDKLKLERCLKSLMPLKESLDCEIIVTDTGSTDGTFEMAKKYADKVLNYNWNDNFAQARNTGIKEAKGLWFMWVDSDEWFEDVVEIAEFFNSGKYKQYASATITLRDYQNNTQKYDTVENESYMDINLRRLVLLSDMTKFEGAIHENVMEIPPLKYLPTVLNHDGYLFQTKEENMLKRNRNIIPLLQEYNNNPKDLSIINYLIREYFMMEDYDLSIEYANKSVDVASGIMDLTNNKEEKLYMKSCILYAKLRIASAYYNTGRDAELIKMLEAEEDNQPKASFLFVDVYGLLFKAQDRLGDSKKALFYAERYMQKYMAYVNNRLDKEYTIGLFISLNHISIIRENISFILDYYIENHDFKKTIEAFDILESLDMEVMNKTYIDYILKIANTFGAYEFINEKYIRISKNESNILLKMLQDGINKNISELTKEDALDMLKGISIIDLEDGYVKLQRLKYLDFSGSKQQIQELMTELIDDELFEIDSMNSSLIYFSLKYDVKLEAIIENMDMQKLSDYVPELIKGHDDIIEVLCSYCNLKNKEKLDIDICYVLISIMEAYTLINNDTKSLVTIYELYSEILPVILGNMYNKNVLNEKYIRFLPPVMQFGYYIDRGNKYRNKEEIAPYLKELKKAVKNYPIMYRPVKLIIDDMEVQMRREQERTAEFSKLAQKIKEKVYVLINEGNDREALSIIAQLQSLLPDDGELRMLKTQIVSNGENSFSKNKHIN